MIDRNGKAEQKYAESTEVKASVKTFTKAINENPVARLLRSQGTAALVAIINSLGAFPCYNATKGVFDKWEDISGEAMAALIKKRGGAAVHKGCSQIEGVSALFNVINAKLGTTYGMEQVSITGVKVLTIEKEFNRKAGLTAKDDRLPKFFYEEPLSQHNKVFEQITDEERMETNLKEES